MLTHSNTYTFQITHTKSSHLCSITKYAASTMKVSYVCHKSRQNMASLQLGGWGFGYATLERGTFQFSNSSRPKCANDLSDGRE